MATTTEKLEDPNLNEEEKDAIVGAFVRHQENERLREQWAKVLKQKHQVSRHATAALPKRAATIRSIILPILAVAAAVLFLFVLLPVLTTDAGEQLLADNLTELSIEGERSGSDAEADSLRNEVRAAFSSESFLAAAASGERLVALPDATEEDRLNLGVSHLRAGNFPLANQSFNQLLEGSGNFTTEARYYLGLSLLSSGNTDEGLTELRKISATDGRNIYQKAQALIAADW